ncbi:protein translocase subunit SecF [Vibrio agarivorans]|uniref:Protein-export membrane protein SecF n=1 Tax=Vibrio agarivorans TaxID=153622 RepID=A0ABT7Y3Z7_9VIBR|nr:protein translocase subunit SecF [Vibrio agarivorans]MDN2482766.1 protein translocase subunit SecF [Vibrio agarivorans]
MKSMMNLSKIRLGMSLLSLVMVLSAVMTIAVKGFNWGLDFTGGVVSEFQTEQSLTADQIKQAFSHALEQDVQLTQSGENGRWLVRYSQPEGEMQSVAVILAEITDDVKVLNSSIVGPQVGQDMVEKGGLAVLTCFVLTMLYLSWRFEWRLALGALGALIYDVVLVLGLFSITGLEFNLTVLAAVLAVLGYSLNDSIIIADRVRELFKGKPNGDTAELINSAIVATFSRTVITSGTTFATVACLWLLGGAPLQGFAIALCFGIVSGTWSSISVGVTLPQLIGLKPEHYIVRKEEYEEEYS